MASIDTGWIKYGCALTEIRIHYGSSMFKAHFLKMQPPLPAIGLQPPRMLYAIVHGLSLKFIKMDHYRRERISKVIIRCFKDYRKKYEIPPFPKEARVVICKFKNGKSIRSLSHDKDHG